MLFSDKCKKLYKPRKDLRMFLDILEWSLENQFWHVACLDKVNNIKNIANIYTNKSNKQVNEKKTIVVGEKVKE